VNFCRVRQIGGPRTLEYMQAQVIKTVEKGRRGGERGVLLLTKSSEEMNKRWNITTKLTSSWPEVHLQQAENCLKHMHEN